MTNQNSAESLNNIIDSALAGRRVIARVDLEFLLPNVSDQASAWIWQAWLSDSPDAMIASLERALSLEPNHPVASAGLVWARQLRDWNSESVINDHEDVGNQETIEQDDVALEADASVREEIQVDNPQLGEATYRIDSARLSDSGQESKTSSDTTIAESQLDHFEAVFDKVQSADNTFDSREETISLLRDCAGVGVSEPVKENEAKLDHLVAEVCAIDDMIATPSGPRGAAPRPLVLAIDDSPTVRKLVSMTLERVGYEVVTAADGVAALNLLAERTPVLILSDITMPRIDGYKLCKLIKKHDKTRDIPVVMLSGKNGVFDKVRGQMAGCTDFINKPFESYDLIDKVRQYAVTDEPALAEL